MQFTAVQRNAIQRITKQNKTIPCNKKGARNKTIPLLSISDREPADLRRFKEDFFLCQEVLAFWPGGGGDLDPACEPRRGLGESRVLSRLRRDSAKSSSYSIHRSISYITYYYLYYL